MLRQQVRGVLYLFDGLADGLPAFLERAYVLRPPLIRLQAGEAQSRRPVDLLRQGQRRLARFDAAALGAHVDLDEHRQFDLVGRCHVVEVPHVDGVIGAHVYLRLLRQRRQALQLARPDHLVADQNVGHPAVHHRLGLADLLATHPDGPQGHLPPGDHGALVRFGVRPQPYRRARHGAGQVLQIAFKGIQVDQQGRGVDLRKRHTDFRWWTRGHGSSPPCSVCAKTPAGSDVRL